MKRFYEKVISHPVVITAVFVILTAFFALCNPLIPVNYDMNDYLPDDSRSTVSLDIMEYEFDGGIPNARIMLKDVTIPQALDYKEKIAAAEGVDDVMWLDDSCDITQPVEAMGKDTVETYYKDGNALLTVTISEEKNLSAVNEIRDIVGEENSLTGSAVSTAVATESTVKEVSVITIIAVIFVIIVLLLTMKSVSLPVILVLAIETAIWLNLSLPYFKGSYVFYIAYLIISSVQLGATVDYAILMTDRYMEFRREMPKKEAVPKTISTVSVSILTSGSVLTVVGLLLGNLSTHGLLAQLGMFVGVGAIFSLAIVFFVLPGLLYIFDGAIRRTTLKADFLPNK